MSARTWVTLSVLFPLSLIPSCARDFDQFDASGRGGITGDGDGDLGGSLSGDGDGGAPGDGDGDDVGDGDSGGATGGVGEPGCDLDEKVCRGECVSNDDPMTSCGAESCEPCPVVPNAQAGCAGGACTTVACHDGYVDCDDTMENGCEHSASTDSEFACGGCSADCTSLGLTDCQNRRCGCAQDNDCGATKQLDAVCEPTERLCVCDGTTCQSGETCVRGNGNSASCECGENGPCPAGRVCCPGSAGPSCKQLDGNDSSNCGACGWQCPSGQVCVSGTCQ